MTKRVLSVERRSGMIRVEVWKCGRLLRRRRFPIHNLDLALAYAGL